MKTDKEELIDLGYWIAVNLFQKHSFEPHPVNNSLCEICNQNSLAHVHVWPHYPVDPAAAMQVLEKLIDGGYTPLLSRAFHSNEQCEMFTVRNGDLGDDYAIAKTLPLAICRFAKALYSK